DLDGNELWTRQFGTAGLDQAIGIAVDASGVYVTGNTTGTFPGQTSAGGEDAFARKYDLNGTELWTRQFGTAGYDLANSIAVDASGVYVAGNEDVEGGLQAFVRKYDAVGTEVWTRQFSSELFGNPSQAEALGVAADASGVYVAGDAGGIFPGQTAYV